MVIKAIKIIEVTKVITKVININFNFVLMGVIIIKVIEGIKVIEVIVEDTKAITTTINPIKF